MEKDTSKDSYDIFKEDDNEFYDHLLEENGDDTEDFFTVPEIESSSQDTSLELEEEQELTLQQKTETNPQSIDLEEKESLQEKLEEEPIQNLEEEQSLQDQKKEEGSTEDMGSEEEEKKTTNIDDAMTDEDIQNLLGEVFPEEIQENQKEDSFETINSIEPEPIAIDSATTNSDIIEPITMEPVTTEPIVDSQDIFSTSEFIEEKELQKPKEKEEEKSSVSNTSVLNKEESETKKKKPNLFKRIFGNIRQERTEEEVQKLKDKVYADAELKEEKEKKKKEREAAAKIAKQEKKKKEAEEKKTKAAEAKKAKAEKDKVKKEAKAAKKEEKTKKKQEIQKLLDEIDENEGKINKIGAAIVFAFFAILGIVLVIGTGMYSYQVSIKNAATHFEYNHYNEAYEEIVGLNIKEQDQELYDKIMTVMYVNKELNSYYSYYDLEMYPEALDSLIKGLKRYELYLSIARTYGVEEDLNFIRTEILTELKEVFHISEAEAYAMLSDEERVVYSTKVYNYVKERFVPPVKETPKQQEENQ